MPVTQYLITFTSITHAMRLKKYFAAKGDIIGVIHTPQGLNHNGCSHSARFKSVYLSTVISAARAMGLPMRAVYSYDGSTYERVNIL